MPSAFKKVRKHILFYNGNKGRGRKVSHICLLECGHACATVHGKKDKRKICYICKQDAKEVPKGYTLISKREYKRLLMAARIPGVKLAA